MKNKYTGRELENLGRLILEHTDSERLENIIGNKNTNQEYYKHLQDCENIILSKFYDLDEYTQDEIKTKLDFQLKENEYQFEVVEILSKTVTIIAENEHDAEDIINDRYIYGVVGLDTTEDWNVTKFNLVNKKEF